MTGQSARPTPTPTPTYASSQDGECRASAEVPAREANQVNGNDRVGSVEERTSRKDGALNTTTTITMPTASGSGTSASSASASAKRRGPAFVPFEAFISPVRSLDKHASHKGKYVDEASQNEIANGTEGPSPTVSRTRMSTGMLGLQKVKGRETGHARRESAVAMFEAYIVRESPRGERTRVSERVDPDGGEGAGAGRRKEGRVEEPVWGDESQRVDVASVGPVEVSGDGADARGNARDASGDVIEGDVGDVTVDATRVDDDETEGEGDTDDTDALLQLASVHLSQTNEEAEGDAVPESAVNEVDMMDEVRCALCSVLTSLTGLGGVGAAHCE